MLRRAESGIVVLGIKPRVHAHRVVVGRDQASERCAGLCFKIGGEAVAAPRLAQRRRGAGAVALGHQRSRQREMAFDGVRRLGAKNAMTVFGSTLSSQATPSARRRNKEMLGQLGLAAMNSR